MLSADQKPLREAIRSLRHAWQTGRPIVPILGAGISVGAGIPIGSQITDYLVRVRYLSKAEGWRDPSEFLLAKGWPSRHRLAGELHARHHFRLTERDSPLEARDLRKSLQATRRDLIIDSLVDEVRLRHPTLASTVERLRKRDDYRDELGKNEGHWASMLQYVTGRNDALIDAFFDRLVRNRQPSTAHQMVAFLTKLVGLRLILTTNFDDLTEVALRDEGMTPVVYEILKSGELPDASIVKRHLSLVKLHGGAFGLRAGFDLDYPLDDHSQAAFQSYIPSDALLLVLGQREEQRVVSLLTALAARAPLSEPGQPLIVWAYYDGADPRGPSKPPKQEPTKRPSGDDETRPGPQLSKRLGPRVNAVPIADAALFLQGLYQSLNFSHPVGRKEYQFLHHLPEMMGSLLEDPPAAASGANPQADAEEKTESETKANDRAALPSPSIKLWFNLYEYRSVATFISALVERLRRVDRWLPPLVLSPVVAYSTGSEAKQWRQLATDYLIHALTREDYLIEIDALRPFVASHPALALGAKNVNRRHERREWLRFCALIGELQKAADKLGGSRIVIGLPKENPPSFDIPVSGPLSIATWSHAGSANGSPSSTRGTEENWAAWANRIYKAYLVASAKKKSADIWGLKKWQLRVLQVACSFRRPRSLVALTRIALRLYREDGAPGSAPSDPVQIRELVDRANANLAPTYERIEMAIEGLVDAGILHAQPGGMFSMPGDQRDALFDAMAAHDQELCFKIQGYIADYYRIDLYEQSKSTAAYLEYVFHRLAAITDGGAAEQLEWLLASLDREREHLIGRGHASMLLDAFDNVMWKLNLLRKGKRASAQQPLLAHARRKIGEMRAEVWHDLTDFDASTKQYEAVHRSNGTPGLDASAIKKAGRQAWKKVCLPQLKQCFLGRNGIDTNRIDHLLDDAERAFKVASCWGARAVIQRGDTDQHALDVLVALERLLYELLERLARTTGRVREQHRQRATLLANWCIAQQIDQRTRWVNPWESDQVKVTTGDLRELGQQFIKATHGLRRYGSGNRLRDLQSRVRCYYARALYLANNFGAANEELNRAHAYASRAVDPEGILSLNIYHLHRAEYCLLHGLHIKSAATTWSLFKSAEVALAQAESSFEHGRRDVFWWGRLFVLRARLALESLRFLHAARDNVPVTLLGRPPEHLTFADESEDSASRFSFHRRDLLKAVRCLSQQDWEVESERITLEALEAISAGMLNIFKHPQRLAVLERIWEELQSQWYSIHGRSDRDAAYRARDSWGRLNARVGLEKHWRKRDQRYEITDLKANLKYVGLKHHYQGLSIRNLHLRGLRIALGKVKLPYGQLKITLKRGKTQVTLRGHVVNSTADGASVALDPLAVDDRDRLNAILKNAKSFPRAGRPENGAFETTVQS